MPIKHPCSPALYADGDELQKGVYVSGRRLSEDDVVQYVLERFADVKRQNRMRHLVAFQAMNKFMIMAHDQDELRKMGRIVASYKKVSLSEIMADYEAHLGAALKKAPTTKSHANVIMHVLGHFSGDLNRDEKKRLFGMLDRFRRGGIALGEILAEISPVIYRFNRTYLASQTYFLLYSDPLHGMQRSTLDKV